MSAFGELESWILEGKNLLIGYASGKARTNALRTRAELGCDAVDLMWWNAGRVAANVRLKDSNCAYRRDVINTACNYLRVQGDITGFVALNGSLEEKRLETAQGGDAAPLTGAVLGNSANPLMNQLRHDPRCRKDFQSWSMFLKLRAIQRWNERFA